MLRKTLFEKFQDRSLYIQILRFAQNVTPQRHNLPFRHAKTPSTCLFVRFYYSANYLLYLSVQTSKKRKEIEYEFQQLYD